MKLTKKLLIAVQILSSLMPLSAGIMAFTNANKMLEMFKVTPLPEMAPLVIILGVCFLSFFILQAVAALLLIKNHPAGRALSLVAGFAIAMSGVGMIFGFLQIGFDGISFGITDIVKGSIILGLAYVSKD